MDSSSTTKKRSFMFIIIILTLLFTLLQVTLGSYLYNKTFDFMIKNVGGKIAKPHEDVVLLLIDQTAIIWGEELGLGRWPWGRRIFSDIIRYLNEKDPPKAIFFDIVFSARDNSFNADGVDNDEVFAEAIADNANIYHNVVFNTNDEDSGLKMPTDVVEHHSIEIINHEKINFPFTYYNEVELPLPCLRADVPCSAKQLDVKDSKPTAMGIAIPVFNSDGDGVYRRTKFAFKYENKFYPSLALSAILAYQDLPNKIEYIGNNTLQAGTTTIPLDDSGSYLANYYIKNRIHNYSMAWLLNSAIQFYQGETADIKLPPGSFKDKIVIIGVSDPSGGDLKNTPIQERTPGPELHATIISNILQNNHIVHTSGFFALITSILLMIITVVIVVYSSNPVIKISSNIAIYSIYGLVSAFVFHKTNYLTHTFFGLSTGIIATMGSYMFLSITEGAERRRYSKVLGNMIDPSIVKEALNDLDALKKGGEKKITAFFSDVASFSTISEKLTSAELASLLNEYLSAMTHLLKSHRGTLDKYIGDAIVGIFGAPLGYEETAINACKASLKMQDELQKLHQKWILENAYCPEARSMSFRIGLNTGVAKVGFMGTDELASYTMMGDTVNLAARLESAGKDYGVNTMISQYTNDEVKEEMVTRILDKVRVKGKEEPVSIYELIGEKDKVDDNTLNFASLCEEGFALYQQRQWQKAVKAFTKAHKLKGIEDKACNLLIARCKYYHKKTPPKNWDGVFTRTHK